VAKAKRKRTPGGGRKATGDFAAKTATFSTRITQETRDRLDRAARISPSPNLRTVSQLAEKLLVEGLDRLDANRERMERPHLDALFSVLRGELDYIASKYGRGYVGMLGADLEIARIFADQLTLKMPRFHSITITLRGEDGEWAGSIYAEKDPNIPGAIRRDKLFTKREEQS
jgi:hypothetical protein